MAGRWANRAFILQHGWMCMGKSTLLFTGNAAIHSGIVEDVYFHMMGMISIKRLLAEKIGLP